MKTNDDVQRLQHDLENLEEWSKVWLLNFHPEKCKHMRIGRKSDATATYTLHGHNLETIHEEKDIGVKIDDNLEFEQHVYEKVQKANQMFGLLRRTFEHLDATTFIPLYKSLVRTHLDFSSSVWKPTKMKHIEMLEAVHRRATKQLPGYGDLSYPERLRKLNLPTLSYRRLHGDLIETFKILSGRDYDRDVANFLPENQPSITNLRGHSKKLFLQRAENNLRKNSFTIRIVKIWNSLPEEIVNAPSVNSFKNRIDEFLQHQDNLLWRLQGNSLHPSSLPQKLM